MRFLSSFSCSSLWKLTSFSCESSRNPSLIDSDEYSTCTQGQIVGEACKEFLLPGRETRGDNLRNNEMSFDLRSWYFLLDAVSTSSICNRMMSTLYWMFEGDQN